MAVTDEQIIARLNGQPIQQASPVLPTKKQKKSSGVFEFGKKLLQNSDVVTNPMVGIPRAFSQSNTGKKVGTYLLGEAKKATTKEGWKEGLQGFQGMFPMKTTGGIAGPSMRPEDAILNLTLGGGGGAPGRLASGISPKVIGTAAEEASLIKSGLKKILPELRGAAQDTYTILKNLTSKELSRGGKVDMDALNAIENYTKKFTEGTLTKADITAAQELHGLLKNGQAEAKRVLPTTLDGQLMDLVGAQPIQRKTGILNTQGGFARNPLVRAADDLPVEGGIERRFTTRAKTVLPEAKKIEGTYPSPRSTDELAMKAKNLIADDIALAERKALGQADDEAVAIASELLKHYSVQAKSAVDMAVKNAIYDKAADVANTMAAKLTEQGRSIQAASILTRLTPEGQVRFAAREIQKWNELNPNRKIPELSGEQAGRIVSKMDEIQKMPDTEARAVQFKKLQDDIMSMVPSTLMKKVVSVWKAGLLTGVKTSGLNIFSNAFHGASEIAKDVPATMADTLLSVFTGKRTKTLTVRGLPSGIKEGVKRGWTYLKTGYDPRDIAKKLDYTKVNFKNKVVQGYVDTVFRVLGTEDQVFYYGALKRSLNDQALAIGKNKGLKGKALDDFVENLIQNPDDKLSTYAVIDAETAVFQNSTALGNAAKKVQEIPGAEFILPFGRTPSSVAMQIINYSPVGFIKTIVENIGKGKFDQRLLSQGLGRATVGTGVLYVGSELFKKGLITLDSPTTERERELWKLEGRKANSIKVGNDWRSVQTFGPLGPVLLIGGHFEKAYSESGSPTEGIVQAIFGTLKSFTEQTFLRGVNNTLSAVMDPERNAEYVASSFLSSFVPTIINDVARSVDPMERRPETVFQRIQSRIPFLREKLEPQVTSLGKEQERIGNPAEVMLDPTRPSEIVSTPLVTELRRLTDAGYKVSPTLLGDKKGYDVLTQKQNTELWKRSGQVAQGKLKGLLTLPSYKKATDEEKAKAVEKVIATAKVVTRAEMAIKLTEGLSGKPLMDKLSELKTGGLLTRDVYSLYLELR